jgi:large subunit ribosomal protein L3
MIKKPQICSLLKMNLDSLAQKTFNEVITTPHTVKISSRSIGKGFAGVIKRFHFKSGRATHGNSKAHNKLGSTGMTQDPGRVFKGKKMPGHLGNKKKSIRNVKVLYISRSRECVFVYGSIPGSIGCEVTVTKT